MTRAQIDGLLQKIESTEKGVYQLKSENENEKGVTYYG